MRDPKDAPPDTLRALKDLRRAVEGLQTENVDLKKRRFLNAHPAVSRGDFITKGQFDDTIANLQTAVTAARRGSSLTAGDVLPGPTPTPPPGGGLPPPNHSIDFGYWYSDGNHPPDRVDFNSEVLSYTNLYVAFCAVGQQYGVSTTPQSDFFANIQTSVQRAFNNSKDIYLGVGLDHPYGSISNHTDQLLTVMAPFWARVKYVDLADEAGWNTNRTNSEVSAFRTAMGTRGLTNKPIGMTFAYTSVAGDQALTASGLDFVALEAYCEVALQNDQDAVIAFVTNLINQARSRVPSKNKVFILQGYGRNNSVGVPSAWPAPASEPNNWSNLATLAKLNETAYLLAKDDTKVVALNIFSYGRFSGTKEMELQGHPEVKSVHRAISAAISGTGGGGGSARCNEGRPCCGGQGNPDNCPRWCSGGDYQEAVGTAYADYIASAPVSVIDPSNPLVILDVPTFMAGVVAMLIHERPDITAQISEGHDGKEITVKLVGDTTFSEQYALWAGNHQIISWSPSPPGSMAARAYKATCYPATI